MYKRDLPDVVQYVRVEIDVTRVRLITSPRIQSRRARTPQHVVEGCIALPYRDPTVASLVPVTLPMPVSALSMKAMKAVMLKRLALPRAPLALYGAASDELVSRTVACAALESGVLYSIGIRTASCRWRLQRAIAAPFLSFSPSALVTADLTRVSVYARQLEPLPNLRSLPCLPRASLS